MNKLGTKLGAIAMSAIMAVSFAPSAVITTLAAESDTPVVGAPVPIYRLYNPYTYEHLFTPDADEVTGLVAKGWDDEGVKWYAPGYPTGTTVYRLFNKYADDHLFTTDLSEIATLTAGGGWALDDVTFESVLATDDNAVGIHRLFMPYQATGTHHYTMSDEEVEDLVAIGWVDENVKFFGWTSTPTVEFAVAIDNPTPKVGDTLTATVEGMAAAEYQWFADDEEIEGATEATLLVTEDMLGTIISVKATAEDMQEATATCTEEVAEGVSIIDVEQTGEYTAIVTFSDSAPNGTITAIKGESKATVNSEYQFSTDRTQAEVVFENRLQADTYTITFTPEAGEPSDFTTTFEVARLASIEFPTGVAVAQSLSNIKTLKVAVMGIDQFGSEIAVPSTTEFTFSKGLKIGDANNADATNVSSFKDGVLTVAAAPTGEAGTAYQSGDYYQLGGLMPLVVTAVWTDGEGHAANGSATLEISNNSVVQSIVWGELTTDDDSYVDKPVTRKSLENANYYVPFVAVDQYGLPVTADDMEKGRTNDTGKTVFVSPDSSNAGGFTAYAGTGDGVMSEDGTTEVVFGVKNVDGEDLDVMYISAGTSPLRAGTVDFNIIPAGGSVQKWSLTVEDDLDIETLDIPKVALQENEKATLTINAYDQNGDEIDFWTYQPTKTAKMDGPTEVGGELLWQIAPGAIYNTKITYTGCGIFVTKDAATKTVSFEIKPSGQKNSVATVMWSTAGQQTGSWTSTVAAPASVEGINTDNMIKYVIPGEDLSFQTSAIDTDHTPIRFVDSNNGKIDSGKKVIAHDALDGYKFGQGEHIDGKYVAYTWRVTPTSTTAVYGAGTINDNYTANLTLAADATAVATTAVTGRKQTGITSVKIGEDTWTAITTGDPSNDDKKVKVAPDTDAAGNKYTLTFEAALSTTDPTTVAVTYTYEEETDATWWTNSNKTTPYEWNAFDDVDQDGNLHARPTKKNGAEIDSPLSDTFTIHLYKLTAPTGGGKATITEIAKKNITLTVVPEASVDYELSVGNMLYTSKGNSITQPGDADPGDSVDGKQLAKVSLSASYKGETVEVGDKTLEASTVSVTEGTIIYSDALAGIEDDTKVTADDAVTPIAALYFDNGGNGSDLDAGTATLYGSVVVGTKLQKLSATVYFDKATPVGTTASLDDGTELTGLIDDLASPTTITRDDGEGDIYILDQYGEYVDGTATIIGYAHHDENGNTIPVDPQTIVKNTLDAHILGFQHDAGVNEACENDTFTLVYSQGTVSMELPVSLHGPSAGAKGNNLGVAFNPVVDETRTDLTDENIDGV